MNRWSRWGAVSIIAVVLGSAGCGDDRPGPVLPPLPPSDSPSPSASPSLSPSIRPTGSPEQQILAQHRIFWTEKYVGLHAVPAAERAAFLRPVVMEPLLSELLRVARERDRAGTALSGTPRSLDPVVTRQGTEAVVSDCVDLTDVVLVNRSTGAVAGGQGTDRRAIDTYLRRGSDAVWRVRSLNDVKDYEC